MHQDYDLKERYYPTFHWYKIRNVIFWSSMLK